MATQQETVSGTSFQIDNLTYDLVTMIYEKSKGLEAYDKYMQDAQGNQECMNLFQQIRQQDSQHVQQLTQALQKVLGGK
jgi:hypothetical protein